MIYPHFVLDPALTSGQQCVPTVCYVNLFIPTWESSGLRGSLVQELLNMK